MRLAEEQYGACQRLARASGNRRDEGAAISVLGQIALKRGRLDEAAAYFQESLTIDREVQDRQGEGVDLAYLGMIANALDNVDDAERYYRDCLALMRDVQDALNEATIALILGQFLAERRGNHDAGCALVRHAIHIRHDFELPGEDEARAVAQELGCAVE